MEDENLRIDRIERTRSPDEDLGKQKDKGDRLSDKKKKTPQLGGRDKPKDIAKGDGRISKRIRRP
jgi:hypothetical protein